MKRFRIVLVIFLFFPFFIVAGPAQEARLLQDIQSIAKKLHAIIGVTAIHIETNKRVSYNGQFPFLMASTVKFPIALTLLDRVDKGQESLNRQIYLNAYHSVPGSGSLYYILNRQPAKKSLKELMTLMLTISDNSASDAILREVQGPQSVASWLQQRGFSHININRSILKLHYDSNGIVPQQNYTAKVHEKLIEHLPPLKRITAWRQVQNDVRDTATPNDMAELLTRLYKNQLLSPASTELLLKVMEACRTGRNRIRALLPPHTIVAHKTGLWTIYSRNMLIRPESKQLYRYASDVGIITLPHGRGHIAIAVYVKSTLANNHSRSQAIALTSKKIYDYFVNSN